MEKLAVSSRRTHDSERIEANRPVPEKLSCCTAVAAGLLTVSCLTLILMGVNDILLDPTTRPRGSWEDRSQLVIDKHLIMLFFCIRGALAACLPPQD